MNNNVQPADAQLRECPFTDFTGLGMSNFDGCIDDGFEEALRTRPVFGQHSAWNFCGQVWFENGQFHERVMRYHKTVAVFSRDTLRELMEAVNDEYGYE